MASLLSPRQHVPQAFVSSYAPRIRTYVNSLLTPVLPANVLPPIRTTKRGTTAINYAEEFDDDSIDDSDGPRRAMRNRRLLDDQQPDKTDGQKEQDKELTAPVDVQAIWREWMGKPKRNMTEKQVQVQAALPLDLVPIRIDLNVAPFLPEPALPKPHNAREMGLDENAAAYRQPAPTPEYRLKDYFLWNLHEALITPDQFAKVFVDDMDFPPDRKQALIMNIAQQIRSQLEEHAGVELHPLLSKDKTRSTQPQISQSRQPLSRDQSSTPFPGTPSGLAVPNSALPSQPGSPLPNGTSIIATAEPIDSVLNPDDSHRCVITLSLNLQNRLLTDKFEWSLLHPPGLPELFARQTCADLGLSGEWLPALAHSIYEAVLKLKKEVVENNGSILGVVGSGVTAWGEVENEAAEVHGDGALAVGEGAGWRFDGDALGVEWEPRVEVLSKDEIEKREGDRERQLRRMRRDMAVRAAPQLNQRESFYGGFGESSILEEERMGRGERAKKKRRFRSLSPVGRGSPDFAAVFGGEAGKLSDAERQIWRCGHCQVWGGAVWSVRDGPSGPRTLCNNCGYLYEHHKTLPPWNKDLYAAERESSTVRPSLAPSSAAPAPPTPNLSSSDYAAAQRASRFVPEPARAHSQTFFRPQPGAYAAPSGAPLSSQALGEQYAATLRGGGPQMFEDYAVQGEDLDWTKVTDPRERKRLQNIINGRKYRERRLVVDGETTGSQSPGPGSPGPYS